MDNKNILNETFAKHLGLLKEKIKSNIEEADQPNLPGVEVGDKKSDSGKFPSEKKQEFWGDFEKQSVKSFVDKYGSWFTDPKFHAFISAGVKDQINDESFSVNPATIPVSGLQPTQNEIGFSNSLNDLIIPTFNTAAQLKELEKMLNGSDVKLGAKGGDVPIVVFAGKYIIDGHHRWSKVYCANKNATVNCLDFSSDKLKGDPSKALKAFHLAIAKLLKDFPTEKKAGANLLTSNKDAVYNHVYNLLILPKAKPFLDVYKKYQNLIAPNLKEQEQLNLLDPNSTKNVNAMDQSKLDPYAKNVSDYISNNAAALIAGTKPATDTPRSHMPQTDKAPGYEKALAAGEINFLPDKVTETALNETFAKHINLLKEYFKNK